MNSYIIRRIKETPNMSDGDWLFALRTATPSQEFHGLASAKEYLRRYDSSVRLFAFHYCGVHGFCTKIGDNEYVITKTK